MSADADDACERVGGSRAARCCGAAPMGISGQQYGRVRRRVWGRASVCAVLETQRAERSSTNMSAQRMHGCIGGQAPSSPPSSYPRMAPLGQQTRHAAHGPRAQSAPPSLHPRLCHCRSVLDPQPQTSTSATLPRPPPTRHSRPTRPSALCARRCP